jgi:hypothetical protein
MDRLASLIIAVSLPVMAAPLAADPGEADRLLKQGFPDRDYCRSPIKLVVAGQRCVLAASAWEFDTQGGARLSDAAIVRVTGIGDREIVEAIAGRSAKVTFDPPVKKAEDLSKSKIVLVETSDGRVMRLK